MGRPKQNQADRIFGGDLAVPLNDKRRGYMSVVSLFLASSVEKKSLVGKTARVRCVLSTPSEIARGGGGWAGLHRGKKTKKKTSMRPSRSELRSRWPECGCKTSRPERKKSGSQRQLLPSSFGIKERGQAISSLPGEPSSLGTDPRPVKKKEISRNPIEKKIAFATQRIWLERGYGSRKNSTQTTEAARRASQLGRPGRRGKATDLSAKH